MPETKIGLRVRIRGRVQGVWYRGWTVQTAQSLGLSGWVRNKSDGSVEALFIGVSDTVEAMVEACREGPPAAIVNGIEESPVKPIPDVTGFRQKESER